MDLFGQNLPDVVEMIVETGLNKKDSFRDFLKDVEEWSLSYELAKSLYGIISRYHKFDELQDVAGSHHNLPEASSASFPGLKIRNDPNRRELELSRPDDHGPLSKVAIELLDRETTGLNQHSHGLHVGSEISARIVGKTGNGYIVSLESGKRHEEGYLPIDEEEEEFTVGEEVRVRVVRIEMTGGGSKGASKRIWCDYPKRRRRFDLDMHSSVRKEVEEFGPITGIPLKIVESSGNRTEYRMSDYEKWENRQLVSSGVTRLASDLTDPSYFCEEDIEIEINEQEPRFLLDQTARSGVEFNEVKVLINPEGSLARAAAKSSVIARERRELKEQTERVLLESIPKDLHRPWEDPKPNPGERTIAATLRNLGGGPHNGTSKQRNFGTGANKSLRSIVEQRESLPIYKFRSDLVHAIKENRVLVVIGETGSGKTTQMAQYIYEEAIATSGGIIGCTQPRRVAAMSIARRVSEEFGCRLGTDVGYTIRFEDVTCIETKIKFMTDGILLRERVIDPLLNRYSVIILDEAHERTINTEILFGLLKDLLRKRDDLRVIVTSATLDAEKFSRYFYNAKIFTIPGRIYPVEIYYIKENNEDYIESSLITVLQIHLTEPIGDILLFLTGQEEIETACEILNNRMTQLAEGSATLPTLIILPIYSSLPNEIQSMIFDPAPPGTRKCIIATNIAEASLTIDGIRYVIDPGLSKVKIYSPKTGIESLTIIPISQANARQRSGRAGRTGPGKCYRLYTEETYKFEMLPTPIPEIQRTNLISIVLQLKAMGINNLLNFDFMDPPPIQTLVNSLQILYELNALDEDGLMTRLGRKMAEFPIEPQLAKILLAAIDLSCTDHVITIISMLQTDHIFYRPKDKQNIADQKKAQFHQQHGDHLTYLHIYLTWAQHKFSNHWCFQNFIQYTNMRHAQEIRKQLITILDRYQFIQNNSSKTSPMNHVNIRKAICSGYFRNAAKKNSTHGYLSLIDNQPVHLHPSSSLYHLQPPFLIYHQLTLTTKEYLRDCSTIDPLWLIQLAPNLYKKVLSHFPCPKDQSIRLRIKVSRLKNSRRKLNRFITDTKNRTHGD